MRVWAAWAMELGRHTHPVRIHVLVDSSERSMRA